MFKTQNRSTVKVMRYLELNPKHQLSGVNICPYSPRFLGEQSQKIKRFREGFWYYQKFSYSKVNLILFIHLNSRLASLDGANLKPNFGHKSTFANKVRH